MTGFFLLPPHLNKPTDTKLYQVSVSQHDYFWLSDPSNPHSELDTYIFKVISFRDNSSAFILNSSLLNHDYCFVFDVAIVSLTEDMYMRTHIHTHTLSHFPRCTLKSTACSPIF